MFHSEGLTPEARLIYYLTWEKAAKEGKASWQCSYIENDTNGIPVRLRQLNCQFCPFYSHRECEEDMMKERTAAEWSEWKGEYV